MTADDIIELAREAGFKDPTPADGYMGNAYDYRDGKDSGGSLTRFAALVRTAALEEAAGVCDDKHDEWRFGDGEDAASGPKDCAAAIRQLKDKT